MTYNCIYLMHMCATAISSSNHSLKRTNANRDALGEVKNVYYNVGSGFLRIPLIYAIISFRSEFSEKEKYYRRLWTTFFWSKHLRLLICWAKLSFSWVVIRSENVTRFGYMYLDVWFSWIDWIMCIKICLHIGWVSAILSAKRANAYIHSMTAWVHTYEYRSIDALCE